MPPDVDPIPDDPAPATPIAPGGGIPIIDFNRPLTPTMWVALATAAILLFVAAIAYIKFNLPDSVFDLFIAVSVALILMVFGGQALFRFGGIAMVGVAAIAAGLFTMLHQIHSSDLQSEIERLKLQKNSFMRGQIEGLPFVSTSASAPHIVVSVRLRDEVVGRPVESLGQFDFLIFADELDKAAIANLIIDKGTPSDSISIGIPLDCISGFMGKERPVRLIFDTRNQTLAKVDSAGKKIIISAIYDSLIIPELCQKTTWQEPLIVAPTSFLPISSAFASILDLFSGSTKVSKNDIERAIANLQSPDSSVYNSAKNRLSQVDPEDVEYVLKKLREKLKTNPAIYRTKLGVAVALTELLRRDKSQRDNMEFEPEDLATLIDLAGSDDRGLRIYAGEFLYDLERPDVARLALQSAKTAINDDARYNLIFLSQGGWRNMSAAQKNELSATIATLNKATRNLAKTTALLARFK
jgi:hypothetical protein